MKGNVSLESRLNRASIILRSGSNQTVKYFDKLVTERKVQTSWGSAMRR
jgi:hypothetical protein